MRRYIASNPRISIFTPGAPEFIRLLVDDEITVALHLQADGHQNPRRAAADDEHARLLVPAEIVRRYLLFKLFYRSGIHVQRILAGPQAWFPKRPDPSCSDWLGPHRSGRLHSRSMQDLKAAIG